MKTRMLQSAVGVIGLALASAGALALQAPGNQADQILPPTPQQQPGPPSVLNYLALLLVIVACAGAASIPSKRGHQD